MSVLSREELFNRAWAMPVSSLAASLGISGVALKKLCANADIPLPDRGHWAKVRAGKDVICPRLPLRGPGMSTTVNIAQPSYYRAWPRNPEVELAALNPIEPVFEEPIETVQARVEQRIGKVAYERELKSCHPTIRKLLAEDELRRAQPRGLPARFWNRKPLFDSPFEKRRLRLLSSLYLALTKTGARPWINDHEARVVGVRVGDQDVRFQFDHPDTTAPRDGVWKTREGFADVLQLVIAGPGAATFADDEESGIETRLRDIVVSLIVAGEINYRTAANELYRRELQHRDDLVEEIRLARLEAARQARAARIAAEQERRETLLGMASDLRAADEIRAIVARVAAAPADAMGSLAGRGLWQAWALEVADRLDPVRRLTIDPSGHSSLQEPEWSKQAFNEDDALESAAKPI